MEVALGAERIGRAVIKGDSLLKMSRIDIIGSNGSDGEHYDMTDTNRSPPQKLAQTVMCPGEGCVINNKCARYVSGEYTYPVFGTTPHQLPQGGCNYFLEKAQ